MKDNEPAFPFEGPTEYYGGLTKREWFAGMAMMGFLSNHDVDPMRTKYITIKEWAYNQADAMLEES
jgi:hypothetical protein